MSDGTKLLSSILLIIIFSTICVTFADRAIIDYKNDNLLKLHSAGIDITLFQCEREAEHSCDYLLPSYERLERLKFEYNLQKKNTK